jgi:hypothetical protein
MLDELRVFRIYMAVKLHYRSKKYDLFEMECRVSGIHREALQSNKARLGVILRAAKRCKTYPEVLEYFMAQHLYGDGNDVFNLMASSENIIRWEKFKFSSTNTILDQLADYDIREITEGEVPEILRLVVGGKVGIETASAIQRIKPYILHDYLGFSRTATIIKKSTRWMKFNEDRVKDELGLHETI